MKMRSLILWLDIVLAFFIVLLSGCHDDDVAGRSKPSEPELFFKKVKSDPVIVNGFALGDSWRLVKEEASYYDGDVLKEFTNDLLQDPETRNYKEYWVFDKNKVLLVFEGNRNGKNWDGYYEIFDQAIDIPGKSITIDYVYDGGDKKYSIDWKITGITETDLIITEERTGYFYQYTFRRERFSK